MQAVGLRDLLHEIERCLRFECCLQLVLEQIGAQMLRESQVAWSDVLNLPEKLFSRRASAVPGGFRPIPPAIVVLGEPDTRGQLRLLSEAPIPVVDERLTETCRRDP